MPQRCARLILFVTILLAAALPADAERLFTLSEDGQTFLYRARPGDHPTGVAEMFGLSPHEVPAFLATNKIEDATRVGAGFEYHIPNTAAQALAERGRALEGENARLTTDLAKANDRVRTLEHDINDAHSSSASAEARVARLTRLEATWPWARAALVLLVLALGGVGAVTKAAMRREGQAERFARTLAGELEEKRKTALAERQESAKRIIDLENRVRALEAQLGPRVVVSGRGS